MNASPITGGSASPEFRLLLALARRGLGVPGLAPDSTGVSWPHFRALVDRHRMGAWLQSFAAPDAATCCPESFRRFMAADSLATTHRALRQAAELLRLLQILRGAGIDALAVKGLVVAQQIHGAIGRRHVGDIDLLVREADVARADAALQGTGLRRSWPDFRLTPRQFASYRRLARDFEYVGTPPATRIELLWRLEGLPDEAANFAGAARCRLGGQMVPTLRSEDHTLYLFQHGSRHGWFRLFWLVDVAVLLRDPTIDWTAIVAVARARGVDRPLLQGATLAEELFGVARPTALCPTLAESRSIRTLVAEAHRQIERPNAPDESVGEWARQTLYRTRLQRGLPARCSILGRHLFSPLNWQTWPLPDRWFFLYYFASPFLWILRRIQRARAAENRPPKSLT